MRDKSTGCALKLTILNSSGSMVTYNLCRRELQQQVGRGWAVVEAVPPPGAACSLEGHVLAPGAQVQTQRLDAAISPGSHHVARLDVPDTEVSNVFIVQP